jgi:hypothetical protein
MTNAKKVLLDINILSLGGKLVFKYKGIEYIINCWDKKYGDKKQYSVRKNSKLLEQGMNVNKITSKYITLYNYDMMGGKTTYKMALEEIEVGMIICG